MPPSATDPRQLLVVLNPARRKALFTLSSDVVSHMRDQLELESGDAEPGADAWSDDDTLYEGEGGAGGGGGGGGRRGGGAPPQARPDRSVPPPSQRLVSLRLDAREFLNKWAEDFLKRLKEIVLEREDPKILDERKKRLERLANDPEPAFFGDDLIGFDQDGDSSGAERPDVATLNTLYTPLPTRLSTLSFHDRKDMLSCMLLLLLVNGSYSAYSRVFLLYLTSSLKLPVSLLMSEETEVAKSLLIASSESEKQKAVMSAEAEAEKRREEGQSSRFWKVGLASIAGAAVIGITGGLAAPVVAGAIGGLMGSVGLGGVASFLGIFWMNGALVGTLFGAFGAKMTGEMMDSYAREVEDFRFIPLRESSSEPETARLENESRRLRVTIGINGWLTSEDDITKPWAGLGDDSEVFALRYEMDKLLSLGKALEGMVSSYAWKTVKLEILRRTVLASLWAALWPAYVLSMATKVDNPFNLALNRSEKAGQVLADALINKVQGERPVTLIGYSLGARAIYTCLRSLAERKAFGLVDTVVLIGAPAPSDVPRWQKLRSVVAGQIFNVYTENDYILGFLYRTHSLQLGVAGLQPVKHVKGIRNLDLSSEVSGHLRYPALTSQILARCGFANIKGGDRPIEREADLSVVGEDPKSEGGDVGELIEFDDVVEPKSLLTPDLSSRLLCETSGASGSRGAGQAPTISPVSGSHLLRTATSSSSTDRLSGLAPLSSTNLASSAPASPSASTEEPPRSAAHSTSSAARSADLPLRQVVPNRAPLAVLEPESLADDIPAGARPRLSDMTRSPLHDSYSSTLAVYDGASDEEAGGIRMVSYDSD
ncbi:uncharacterized protein DNG_04944 [Cephalotrichum gorgonifer]|uniref:DUF726 domain-containing protein n=1 Tax=Cephalotrichum gorgonifer TaxID=2041049 RepID=A0AAE8MWZ6_9PEZI|nr:uncharacterized protein DNG_04944 [Cephalotrichum gorgonifer]